MMFDGQKDDPRLQRVLGSNQVTAVGGIDDVKIQFDVQGLVLVLGNMSSALRCALPRELYRFQRRESLRVRSLVRSSPVARIVHPGLPELLRILDVSSGGCALLLPQDAPPIEAGTVLRGVVLDLEVNVHVQTDLRVQHVYPQAACSTGNKLGCQFLNPNSSSLRNLHHYIAQTQKRTRLVNH
jgi:c-di-GMP-binding flagellar brake protein YcgR